eukprot:1436087-Rhodomonas_salina.2
MVRLCEEVREVRGGREGGREGERRRDLVGAIIDEERIRDIEAPLLPHAHVNTRMEVESTRAWIASRGGD